MEVPASTQRGRQLIVSAGVDPKAGKRVQHTKAVRATRRGDGRWPSSWCTATKALDAWLERARDDLSPSTVRTQLLIELYLRPTMGKVPLRARARRSGPARPPPT
ncbi:MAG: hypothetical protein R2749_05690 [Acidimicrobiales bacterium]